MEPHENGDVGERADDTASAVQPMTDLKLDLSQRCVGRGHHSPKLCTYHKLGASSPAVQQDQVP